MIFKAHPVGEVAANYSLRIRCPSCRHKGTFEKIQNHDFQTSRPIAGKPNATETVLMGQRRCPDPHCHAHVFFVTARNQVVVTYPAETIDFDSTSLPKPVIDAFEEAIICHANNCYVASAIMVRKSLEELCRDRKAKGDNLKKRIEALGKNVVLPKELLDGIDDLRLLGNDAAHIESQTFDQIGPEEVEIGIEFTKEVLKAVYQYGTLLERLRSLKKKSNDG
ncbi:MAG: DUF4145 domain-containing protein [Deltaproteobacteria bacterium]|nr:DUF4145 domain-containing protein [Deltaproteobacteria bacterium]